MSPSMVVPTMRPLLLPVVAALALAGAPANGAAPDPVWALGPTDPELQARVGGGWDSGFIPDFRASERDRRAAWGAVTWTPAPMVSAWLQGGLAWDRAPAGMTWTAPTTLTVGTRLRPLAPARSGAPARLAPVDLGLSWWAGLPLSADRGAVDSDETDLSFSLEVGRALGPLRLDGALGLAILGNPLRLANQDDQPLVGLVAAWAPAPAARWPIEVHARGGGSLRTPRNPARTEAAVGLELACPLALGLEAGAGLSPAAPDLLLRAWLGRVRACRGGARD